MPFSLEKTRATGSKSVRILSDADFANALALEKTFFDSPSGAYGFMEDARQAILVDEMLALELDVMAGTEVPESATVRLGTETHRKVPRRSWAEKVTRIKLRQNLLITDDAKREAKTQEEVIAIARQLFNDLKTSSPPSTQAKNHTWRYRQMFRFLIGGTAYLSIPTELNFTVIGITNISPHASTLEGPTWPQPFTKMWRKVYAKSKRDKFDARFSYIRGGSVPFRRYAYWEDRGYELGQTTPFGVTLIKQDFNYDRFIRYASPVIWIGPYGSMGGKTGIFPTPRRRRTRRRI